MACICTWSQLRFESTSVIWASTSTEGSSRGIPILLTTKLPWLWSIARNGWSVHSIMISAVSTLVGAIGHHGWFVCWLIIWKIVTILTSSIIWKCGFNLRHIVTLSLTIILIIYSLGKWSVSWMRISSSSSVIAYNGHSFFKKPETLSCLLDVLPGVSCSVHLWIHLDFLIILIKIRILTIYNL